MAIGSDQYITIAQYSTEPEAYIASGMLADNGIDARVVSNNMATLYGAGATWAPILLTVPATDASRARNLLTVHGDL